MADQTEPQVIDRRLALIECGEGMQVEVFALRRRYCFGRHDIYVEPARGQGGKWVREVSLEYVEPEPGGSDE